MSSCATIVSGSKQNVKFSSNPTSATIFIDEVEVGKTPFEIKLARKSEHSVMLKLEGYQTYQTKLTKKFNAWFLGNILIGGLIGIIIDPITGAIYNLSPEEINAQMNKGIAFKSNGKDVYIAVALNIDSSWKKVGQLEKVNN
jgi:hypothetical protein